jgi:hypothetical protein
MYLFKWRAVIYLCIYLNGGLLFRYLFIYFICGLLKKSRALVFGIVTRLRTVRSVVNIAATSFFLLQNALTSSEAHLASYSVRTGDPFPQVKWSELEADQLSSSNSEGKKKWCCGPAPP